jgi:poly(3-hydroxybutyrate) depolymerase
MFADPLARIFAWSARSAATVLGALMGLLAGSTGAARAQGVSDACAQAPTAGDAAVTLSSGGRERTALVPLPPAPAGQRLPVLLALHGAGQNGPFFAGYSGFSVVADAKRFIAVYPLLRRHVRAPAFARPLSAVAGR